MAKHLKIEISEKFYHASKVRVLKDCCLEVEPGEFVTILGQSGCGKSTLLKTILGIDMDFDGEIFLGEHLIKSPSKNCSIVFQDVRLFPWMSVKNNIFYALDRIEKKHKDQLKSLLKLLDLTDFSNEFPSSLSGGMAQKTALARALINLPDLLLLDEPFASLDYITKMRLQNEFVTILASLNTTVLMVTHDIEEAVFVSDRILVMSPKPGKIIKTFDVRLAKPRDRTSKEFLEMHQSVLDYMIDVLHII